MAEFFQLSGQVALVTGGGQGIGAGIAARLAAAGARVAIFDAVLRSVFMVSVPCIRNASRAGTVPEGPSQRER